MHEHYLQLVAALEWYVEEDDTNLTESNTYWLRGKQRALRALAAAYAELGRPPSARVENQLAALSYFFKE